jgi:hypothetical protein
LPLTSPISHSPSPCRPHRPNGCEQGAQSAGGAAEIADLDQRVRSRAAPDRPATPGSSAQGSACPAERTMRHLHLVECPQQASRPAAVAGDCANSHRSKSMPETAHRDSDSSIAGIRAPPAGFQLQQERPRSIVNYSVICRAYPEPLGGSRWFAAVTCNNSGYENHPD